jgi:hypothetical protein
MDFPKSRLSHFYEQPEKCLLKQNRKASEKHRYVRGAKLLDCNQLNIGSNASPARGALLWLATGSCALRRL